MGALSWSVYVVKAADQDEPVKIGLARSPHRRLSALQHWSPLPLVIASALVFEGKAAASKVERVSHRMLSMSRCWGEWFKVDAAQARLVIERAAGEFDLAWQPWSETPRHGPNAQRRAQAIALAPLMVGIRPDTPIERFWAEFDGNLARVRGDD